MKFGICGGLELAEPMFAAGFDYLEVGATGFAMRDDFDPSEYRRCRVEAANLFFPSSVRLFGPEPTDTTEYIETILARAEAIGVETLVIGSGGSRRAPEGTDVSKAESEFVEFIAKIQRRALPKGIRMAPEGLNRHETNVGNDLPALARALRTQSVGYCADSYHVLVEWKEQGGIDTPSKEFWQRQIPFAPDHVHVGDLPRNSPDAGDPHMIGFATRLKDLGYNGRISVEARRKDNSKEEFTRILAHLRALFS